VLILINFMLMQSIPDSQIHVVTPSNNYYTEELAGVNFLHEYLLEPCACIRLIEDYRSMVRLYPIGGACAIASTTY